MTAWTIDELNRVGGTEEVQIAALRADGTLGKPVIVWIVRARGSVRTLCQRPKRRLVS